MSAMLKSFAPWSLSEAVVSDLVRRGAHAFDEAVDPRRCEALLREIRAACRFDENLFLSEAEFDADPHRAGANAGPERNLLQRLEDKLAFVEHAPQIVEALWTLLGPDYRIVDKKIVCAAPARAIPAWIRRRLEAGPLCDLSAFVRPEYRDLTYVQDAPFRQDLSEQDHRAADVVTLRVQLNALSEADAPTCLLEGSHRMGASAFPPELKRVGADSWRYRNGRWGDMFVTETALAGEAGSAALWHACTLHGAQPLAGDQPQIALVYRIARGEAKAAGIDGVNATLAGPLSLAERDHD